MTNSRGKEDQQARRKARLAAALRENLKRRKAQARGRAENKPNDDAVLPGTERKEHAPDFRRNRSSE
jgi:hypothetical protein